MIVTIDGPAGAGKSSIAKKIAQQFGFDFLDTGAMYRAITLGAIRALIDWHDVDALVLYAQRAELEWKDDRIFLDGQDVSDEIRTPVVTSAIHFVADLPAVREQLSRLQRKIACGRDIVTDGRDQGTDVFPDADCKIFLTASPQERARRRQNQLKQAGRFQPIEEILAAQNARDDEDQSRAVGALRPADDAVVLDTDGMDTEDVLQQVSKIIANCQQMTRS